MSASRRRSSRLSIAFVILLGVLVTLLPATAHAALAAPTGLSPSGVALDAGIPTLEWDRVPNAVAYEVEVLNPVTGTSLFLVRTTNRRYVPTRYLPSTVEWRVRAIDSGNVRGAWGEGSFSIGEAAGPKPDPVGDGINPLRQPEEPPLLTWERLRGAVKYIVEVSTDGFLTAAKYETTNPAFVVPAPMADRTYEWRVTADFGDGVLSRPSDKSTYTIGPLAPVEPVYPQDDIDFSIEDVYLDWEPVKGAVTYDLWVSTDPDFNETATVKIPGIKSTRYSPPITYLNDQYYWKVRAVNSRTETIDWVQVDHQNFRRHWPDRPELLHPADRLSPADGDPFYFEWTPVQHASHYELELGTDPNFSPGTFESCKTAATTYTPEGISDRCTPSQGGVYYWRVRGIDNPRPVVGLYSAVRRFVYDSGEVQQSSPAPGATVPVPTLRWQHSRDAEKYLVRVTDATGDMTTKETYALSWTPPLKAADGPFTWSVQARDADSKLSPRYPGRSFTIAGELPTTGAAPLTPLSGTTSDAATTRFPVLRWEPVAGAAYYKVEMGPHGSDYLYDASYTELLRERLTYPAATDTGAKLLTPGSYDWRVTAFGSNGASLGTGPFATFTISDLDEVTGQRIALTGSALDAGTSCAATLRDDDICTNVPSTPVLEWDPVPGAAYYMVYLSRDRELTNLVMPPDETVNTRWTPTLRNNPWVLPDSQAGKPYHWIIRPCKARGHCAPDPVSTHESAMHAFDKVSPQPTELSATTANDITFTWQDYYETNRATPYDAIDGVVDEVSYQSAMKYRIEVATNDSFTSTSLVDSREVDQATYTPFDRTYPEGTLWWRVQAIDDANNRLTWSAPQSFVKDSGRPTLRSPVSPDGTDDSAPETDGLAPLRWEPQDFAKSYTVEVYANNDTQTFSPTNLLFRANTEQTAFLWDKPIPASDKLYVWRVRRNDADNRVGSWSVLGKFRSTGEVPTQTAPGAGAYVRGDEAEFAWSHVKGARSYRVEVRRTGSTSVSSQITRVNAWAPTTSLGDGSWDWRVTALDVSNATIGVSPWRQLVVDATAPLVTSKSPATRGKVTTNFVARFSEPVRLVTSSTFTVKRKGTTKALPANVTLSPDGKVATLNPSANLKRGQVYVVKLTSGITDLAGNPLPKTGWKVSIR